MNCHPLQESSALNQAAACSKVKRLAFEAEKEAKEKEGSQSVAYAPLQEDLLLL